MISEYNAKPAIINIEITNACNSKCIFCDRPILAKRMKIVDIDSALLKKILSDVSRIRVYELGLVGLGEPVLDKNLSTHLKIINRYKDVFKRISINTNGICLDQEKSVLILNSAINHITFSLNATNPALYFKLMHRDSYHKVTQHIHDFFVLRKDFGRDDLIFARERFINFIKFIFV